MFVRSDHIYEVFTPSVSTVWPPFLMRNNLFYQVEAKTMTEEQDPFILPYCTAKPRPVSNGKYGIWGYDIQYLVLESIVYDDLTDTWNVVPCVEQPGM